MNNIMENTLRYRDLFEKVIDFHMPERSNDTDPDDIDAFDDLLLNQRLMNLAN